MRPIIMGLLITSGMFSVVGIVFGGMYWAQRAGGTWAMVAIAFLWLWLIFSFLVSLDPKRRGEK